MKRNFLIAIAGLITVITVWITFIHIDWLSQVQELVKTSGIWGSVIFVIAYAIATLLILPVTALNIAGGALYGVLTGLLLTSLGALISALLGFILARSLGTKLITSEYNSADNLSNVGQNLVKGGIGYAFAARLLPVIPYGVVSIAAGLSPIKRRDYLLGTLMGTPLGIAPFVFLGSTGEQVLSKNDVLPLLASSMGLAMLVAVGTWYRSRQKHELAQGDYAED
ncbi:MAG: TVP38/TMEM64 family protein [Pseudanabaena sp.]